MLEKRQKLIAMARRWDQSSGKPQISGGSKKSIGIEALLRWAYFDELPKAWERRRKPLQAFSEGWASLAEFGGYLALIDKAACNLWGGMTHISHWGEPHEDALAAGRAVDDLDHQQIKLPQDWDPFSDVPHLGAAGEAARARVLSRVKMQDGRGRVKLRIKPSALVFNYTILGGCPSWEGAKRLTLANFTESRPDPDPADVGFCRAEYAIWRIALDVLARNLSGRLTRYEVLAALYPQRPWETAPHDGNRILPDLNEPPVR